MIESTEQLLHELRARGLAADGPAGDPGSSHATNRPWYVSLLLGAAGWIAGIFLLIFVFMLFKPEGAGPALVVGLVLLAAAWGLFKVDREGAFVSQLALALSVAGQFAVLYGIGDTFFKGTREIAGIALVALVLQVALIVAMPNRLHRTMSALFACMAWALLVRYGLWDQAEWGGSRDTPAAHSLGLALLGWAIAWLPVGGLLYVVAHREPTWIAQGRQAIVRPAVVGLIVGLAVATLLSQPFDSFRWGGRTEVQQGWLAIWPLLSALAALGALAAAFAMGNRGLTAMCVVAALVHVSHFYYAMGATLLIKSATMIVLGALLLAAAHHLKQKASP